VYIHKNVMVGHREVNSKYPIFINAFEAGVLTALILKSDEKERRALKELLEQLSALYSKLAEGRKENE